MSYGIVGDPTRYGYITTAVCPSCHQPNGWCVCTAGMPAETYPWPVATPVHPVIKGAWSCPKCDRVWAPHVDGCKNCNEGKV